jgi:ubiquinone/menaquinone biosynthesis C-methylase UbiE
VPQVLSARRDGREAGVSELNLTEAFDRAAGRYDLMAGMNPGYHQHLRAAANALLERTGPGPVLDLGCGSGASTRALVAAGAEDVLGVDASAGMLARARAKQWPAGVQFLQSRAEDLDIAVNGFRPRGVLAAYLFRNLGPTERDRVLAQLHDRLAPAGWLVVHDYAFGTDSAEPDGSESPLTRARWSAVCWSVIIPLAAVLLGDTTLYRYLWRSVRRFDSTGRFADRLVEAGFCDVAVRTVPGWQHGLLHIWVARRPALAR